MTIPDATLGSLYHDSAMFLVQFYQMSENVWSYQQELAVDSTTSFSLSVFSSLDEHIEIALTDPSGAAFDLTPYASKVCQTILRRQAS